MRVRVCGSTSAPFPIDRGVRQGSVLSPVLFLLVMDPLLLQLSSSSCGLSVCGLYLGALSHADDIRTLSTNLCDTRAQITTVGNFATSKGLSLCSEKCEAVISPSTPGSLPAIHGIDISIPTTSAARCLGAWWTPNLSCSRWIEENIKKARAAFFARGSGVFHGTLNPLSSRSIVESCILPVLLYGAESWILNSTLLQKLESFQAELAKRILQPPKFSSNNVSRLALCWPSIRARVLCIKLQFLLKVIRNDDSLSSHVFRCLAASDVESIHLVRQCRFLESEYETNFTTTVISSNTCSIRPIMREILNADLNFLHEEAVSRPSQHYVHIVAAGPNSSWPTVWDAALDRGPFGSICCLALLRLLSMFTFSDGLCPVPDCPHQIISESPCIHFLTAHTPLTISIDDCVQSLIDCSEDMFEYGLTVHDSLRAIWPH